MSAVLFILTKMPQGERRFVLVENSEDRQRTFEGLLGEDFYASTVVTHSMLAKGPFNREQFFADHTRAEGAEWVEERPGTWLHKGATS